MPASRHAHLSAITESGEPSTPTTIRRTAGTDIPESPHCLVDAAWHRQPHCQEAPGSVLSSPREVGQGFRVVPMPDRNLWAPRARDPDENFSKVTAVQPRAM